MQLDIAKSFSIAGYFPRVRFALLLLLLLFIMHTRRPAKLRQYLADMAVAKGELMPGDIRVSGRRRDEQVRLRSRSFRS